MSAEQSEEKISLFIISNKFACNVVVKVVELSCNKMNCKIHDILKLV